MVKVNSKEQKYRCLSKGIDRLSELGKQYWRVIIGQRTIITFHIGKGIGTI